MRNLCNYPDLWKLSVCQMISIIPKEHINSSTIISAVPHGAVPIGVSIAYELGLPYYYLRKDQKKHGQVQKLLNGKCNSQCNSCIIIEDVTTTRGSLADAVEELHEMGIQNIYPISIIDRKCSNKINIPNFRSLYSHKDLLRHIDLNKYLNYIKKKKQSNLIFSADIPDPRSIVATLSSHIIGVKLHSEIIEDNVIFLDLLNMSYEHDFIIIEDRKMADISKIHDKQLGSFSSYADIVTVHGLSGFDPTPFAKHNIKVLLISEMSSSGNMIDKDYTNYVYDLAKKYSDIVVGVIGQKKNIEYDISLWTPGIQICETKNEKEGQSPQGHQTYRMLEDAQESDYIIIGSELYMANDPLNMVSTYKTNIIHSLTLKNKDL